MRVFRFLLSAIVTLWIGCAHASLIGNLATCAVRPDIHWPTVVSCAPDQATVGAGVEFSAPTSLAGVMWSVDIRSSAIFFSFAGDDVYDNNYAQIELGGLTGLVDFDIDGHWRIITAEPIYPVITLARTLGTMSITLPTQWHPNQSYLVEYVPPKVRGVPEPSTYLLACFALAVLVGLRMGRNKSQAFA